MKHTVFFGKRILTGVLFCLVLLSLAACGEKESALSVSPYNAESTISSEIEISIAPIWAAIPDRLDILVENKTEKTFTYENDWSMEYLENGVWKTIPFKTKPQWNVEKRTIRAKNSVRLNLDCTMLDFSFPNGTYRIIKRFGDVVAAGEFKIGETVENMPRSKHGALPDTANGISVYTEFPTYKSTDASARLIIENNSGKTLFFDEDLYLEYLSDGVWVNVHMRPDAYWNALGHETDGIGRLSCYFSKFAFNFPEGTYRIVKELNGVFYAAEFKIES